MNGMTRRLWMPCCALALVACTAVPAFAADNPWVGTWKLDKAKSHMTGQTITYSKDSSGMDHFSDGATEYTFTANGVDYPTMGGATESWSFTGHDAWKVTDKVNGKVVSTTDVKISPDGKTMKMVTTGTRPDGSAINDEDTYSRVKGGPGLEGTWKSVKVENSSPGMWIVSQNSPTDWKWEIPDWKETLTGNPDGSDLTLTGPEVASGLAVAIKVDGHKLTYVVKENGKPIGQGQQMLAANGKSFTDESWVPGKENEKQTSVYVKQ